MVKNPGSEQYVSGPVSSRDSHTYFQPRIIPKMSNATAPAKPTCDGIGNHGKKIKVTWVSGIAITVMATVPYFWISI